MRTTIEAIERQVKRWEALDRQAYHYATTDIGDIYAMRADRERVALVCMLVATSEHDIRDVLPTTGHSRELFLDCVGIAKSPLVAARIGGAA